jgi:hypothetical protein
LAGLLSSAIATDAHAAQDYCKYGDELTLVLVDRTTQYDNLDRDIFIEGIDVLFASLKTGERVILQTIQEGYASSEKLFDSCLPGCPDVGMLQSLFSDCSGARAKGDELRFKAELAKEIKDIVDTPESFARSDILLTLSALSDQYATRNASEKLSKLFVFSDLLENSELLPWPQVASPSTDHTLQRVKHAGALAKLNRAKVYVYGFGRLHDAARSSLTPQVRQALLKFWRAYFSESGGTDIHIEQRLD